MPNITIDIETLPCADEALLADVIAKVAPPKTLKKAESIEAWWRDEGEAAKAEAIARAALDGTYGRICCIGWKIDDAPSNALIGDEDDIIPAFFNVCIEAAKIEHYNAPVRTHTLIGHNLAGFDLRFLWQRAVVHGIPRPPCMPWKAKPWDDTIQDTMLMWSPDRERRISLDRLCRVLKVPSPKLGGFDGSQIAQAWADGKQKEIADYCRADVEATYLCWKAMAQ